MREGEVRGDVGGVVQHWVRAPFRIQGSEFRVQRSGSRVRGLRCAV